MVALALVGIAMMSCSENDLTENSPKGKTVTLTTTISLDGSSVATRALDADGKKTFAKDEQIALIYESAADGVQKVFSAKLQETDITNNGKNATLTFNLEKAPKGGGKLRYIYPAAMAVETIGTDDAINNENTLDFSKLQNQDGTLASLASKLDLAVYDGNFTSDATLPGSAVLTNQLAIIEFTITDYDGINDITSAITNLEIDQGTGNFGYTVTRTAAAGPIYVAMMPTENAKENITISALANTTLYEKEVKDVTLKANNMYPVTVKTFKVVDLSTLTSDYEAQNGEMLTGTLGTNVKISIAAGATVTLKDANINMDDDGHAKWTSGDYAGITCLGDATIVLSGTNKVHAFANGYPGIQVAHNTARDTDPSKPEYTLTIQGDGSLEAKGSDDGAGIGSGKQGTCGDITISGGTITAEGDGTGAGIGSGGDWGDCGKITISGGTIKSAKGGGAGIGSGTNGKCGNITISGGTIESAMSYLTSGSAGIGSATGSICGDITISGGTITATGNISAAGIGSGDQGRCGAITITTGVTKVTATMVRDAYCIGPSFTSISCGTVTYGSKLVYNGTAWESGVSLAVGDHQYGGLNFNVKSDSSGEIWTLTPTSSN